MTNNSRDIAQSIRLNLWFIRLRWIAIAVALILVFITIKIFHYLPDGNFWSLLFLIFVLAFTNLVYSYFIKKNIFTKHLKELQILNGMLQFCICEQEQT
ncbi:MAG: hypothetical protein O6940_05600 [Ignavibacteria bacterium]|nr:hypothetical protein [Ignavibacteria bacterium]